MPKRPLRITKVTRTKLKVGKPHIEEGELVYPVKAPDGTIYEMVADEDGWMILQPGTWDVLGDMKGFNTREHAVTVFARRLDLLRPLPPVHGKKDPTFKNMLLVPVDEAPKHAAFPTVVKSGREGLHYRFVPKTKEVECMVTVMPDGVRLAWDICGACARYFTICICMAGVTPPGQVGWMRAVTDRWMAGESLADTAHASQPSTAVDAGDRALVRPKATKVRQKASQGRAGASVPAPTTQKAQKKINKADTMVDGIDLSNIDMGALNKAATEQAAADTKKILKKKRRS